MLTHGSETIVQVLRGANRALEIYWLTPKYASFLLPTNCGIHEAQITGATASCHIPRNETDYGLVLRTENYNRQLLAYNEACPVNQKRPLLQQASEVPTFI